ncbi:uncharacterized protein METZ01_LOCUS257853, partial [marine metagenome]
MSPEKVADHRWEVGVLPKDTPPQDRLG